jgi:phosphorylcholine metabolism protein LicD
MARGKKCTPKTPQCETSYLNKGLPTPSCCQENLTNLLLATVEAFQNAGVRYWLDYGSLLGAVREGGIIKWDNDADLGVLIEDYPKLLKTQRELEKGGHVLRTLNPGNYVRTQVSKTNKIHVCIFIWHPHKDDPKMLTRKRYFEIDDRQNKGKDFPREWVDELSLVSWEGIPVSAPQNPELMLKHRYGDWRTPVKHREKK